METVSLRRRQVYRCRDEYGILEVVDEGPVRSLLFGTEARQSAMLLSAPDSLVMAYTRCMAVALALVEPSVRRVLLLGLGGGSLAKYVLARFPCCRVDAVEMRPQVVEVARRFFRLPTDARLEIHVSAAHPFLTRARPGTWDVIFADMYDDRGMAWDADVATMLGCCRAALSADGVMAINLWPGSGTCPPAGVQAHLRECFGGRVVEMVVPGKSTCVGLAFKASLGVSQRERMGVGRRRRALGSG